MLGQKFSLFFMSAVDCLVAIYAILHLIENVHKNCAISLSALIIFIESMIPYFWVLHVAKKYQSITKLLRMRFRKHKVIYQKTKSYDEIEALTRFFFTLLQNMKQQIPNHISIFTKKITNSMYTYTHKQNINIHTD